MYPTLTVLVGGLSVYGQINGYRLIEMIILFASSRSFTNVETSPYIYVLSVSGIQAAHNLCRYNIERLNGSC